MQIFLLRHTSLAVAKGLCYGASEVGLSDSYLTELEQIRRKAPWSSPKIFSSPLKRCRQLALDLASASGSAPQTDGRLKELDFGLWEMQPWEALQSDSLQRWHDDFVNRAPPGGESYRSLQERSIDFLQESLQEGLKANIPELLLVTHAGVIRALLSYAASIPLESSFYFAVKTSGITHIEKVKGGGYRILGFNL